MLTWGDRIQCSYLACCGLLMLCCFWLLILGAMSDLGGLILGAIALGGNCYWGQWLLLGAMSDLGGDCSWGQRFTLGGKDCTLVKGEHVQPGLAPYLYPPGCRGTSGVALRKKGDLGVAIRRRICLGARILSSGRFAMASYLLLGGYVSTPKFLHFLLFYFIYLFSPNFKNFDLEKPEIFDFRAISHTAIWLRKFWKTCFI